MSKLVEHLDALTPVAAEITKTLTPLALQKVGSHPVHFRPTKNGITLVSLLPDSPQLGRGGYKSAAGLKEIFDTEYQTYCRDRTLGRLTPEKHLQSWLIANSYSHGRKLQAICDAHEDTSEQLDLYFLTDEIALPVDTNGVGKESWIKCDILAITFDCKGLATPVLIELKSRRELKRLTEQLTDFVDQIELHPNPFHAFFNSLWGKSLSYSDTIGKWLVWPTTSAGLVADRREAELQGQGIRVVRYSKISGNGYAFHVGVPPDSMPV